MFKGIRSKVLISTLAAMLVIAPAAAGQDDKSIKLQADLVAVDATVTDKDGSFIRNLKAEDFVVYEDGEPQKLDFFEANEEAAMTRPLAVVVAIDTSGSIKPEEITRQREATESFMKLVRPESVFAVIAFNSEIRVLQDFTREARRVRQAFQKIGGGAGRRLQPRYDDAARWRSPRAPDGGRRFYGRPQGRPPRLQGDMRRDTLKLHA